MSVKPSPGVWTVSVALAMVAASTRPTVDRLFTTAAPAAGRGSLRHVLLQAHDGLDQPAPGALDKGHGAVEIGPVGEAQVLVAAAGLGRIHLHAARQVETAAEHLFLQCGILGLQAGDLALERGAFLGDR